MSKSAVVDKVQINSRMSMPPEPRRPLVFLSHSYKDARQPLFERLLNDLRADDRIRLWYGPDQLHVGDGLYASIQNAISEADFYLYVVSAGPTSKIGILQEFRLAYADQLVKQRAKIIPIRLDDSPLPVMVSSLISVDLTQDYARRYSELMDGIVAASQTPVVTFPIDTIVEKSPIIQVGDIIGRRLIEHFAEHPEELKTMNRRKFEELVAELFRGFGYDVELTKQTRDRGPDIIAVAHREVRVRYLIECKRPDPGGHVGIRPVRELYAVKLDELATKAILATTAYFSPDALLFFENHRWELEPRDFQGLLEWIAIYLRPPLPPDKSS